MARILIISLMATLVACSSQKENAAEEKQEKTDSSNVESAVPQPSREFIVSAYTSDDQKTPNIIPPGKSTIKDFTFSEKELLTSWVENPSPDTPHATFLIDRKSFFLVDFDGGGDMSYEIVKDSITVYFPDFVQKGQIKELNREELKIHWNNNDSATTYYRWKH